MKPILKPLQHFPDRMSIEEELLYFQDVKVNQGHNLKGREHADLNAHITRLKTALSNDLTVLSQSLEK